MPTPLILTLLPLAAAVLANVAPLAAQQPSEAGFVVSKQGEWFVSSHGTGPLSTGQVVHAGDLVWSEGRRTEGDYLRIALYAGGGPFEVLCSQPAACDRRHRVPAEVAGEGLVEEWLRRAGDFFRRDTLHYVPGSMRTSPPPQEAILRRDSVGVDLAPALTRIPSGMLRLQAAALDSAAVPGEWRSLQVDWNRGTPALVARDSMPPGLYALRLPGQPDGWVLVVDASPEAEALSARFGEFSARLRDWGRGGGAQRDSRTVLRALLHQLAVQGLEPSLAL